MSCFWETEKFTFMILVGVFRPLKSWETLLVLRVFKSNQSYYVHQSYEIAVARNWILHLFSSEFFLFRVDNFLLRTTLLSPGGFQNLFSSQFKLLQTYSKLIRFDLFLLLLLTKKQCWSQLTTFQIFKRLMNFKLI